MNFRRYTTNDYYQVPRCPSCDEEITEANYARGDAYVCSCGEVVFLNDGSKPQRVSVKTTTKVSVTVPDIVDSVESVGVATLLSGGYVVGDATDDVSTTIAIGNILSQDPAADASASYGDTVDYVVSLGTQVPAGIDVLEATFLSDLTTAGLIAGVRTEDNDPVIIAGNIISVDPVATTYVEPGSAVAYVVSLGAA